MGIGIEKYSQIASNTSLMMQNVTEKKSAEGAAAGYNVQKDTYEHVGQTSTSKTQDTANVKLSDKAQKVLDELKQKYGNTDFFVADYSSDEEAGQILSNSTKDFGVLITPDELEKMAADEDYKNKISGTIGESEGKISDFRNSLSDDEKSQIKNIGLSISDDGTVKYFAEIEKQTKAAADRIKEAKESQKSDSKDKQDVNTKTDTQRTQKKYVKGGTLDELSAAIDKFLSADDENTVPASHIDYQL